MSRSLVMALACLLALALCAVPVLAQARTKAPAPEQETMFDPVKYSIGNFLKDVENDTNPGNVGLAIVWGFGFMAGKDEAFVRDLSPEVVQTLTLKYLLVGKEKPQLTFLDATREVMRLSTELRRPASAAPAQK